MKGVRQFMEKYCVIGVFPPPYGGATVKCQLFCSLLERKQVPYRMVDLYTMSRRKLTAPFVLLRAVLSFLKNENIVYCLDSKRLGFILRFQEIFPATFAKTNVLVIGGVFHDTLQKNKRLWKLMKQVKCLWVETAGMASKLGAMGLQNVKVFPNPKSEIGACEPRFSSDSETIKLVYFSQVSEQKGILETLALAERLKKEGIPYKLDIYGHVVTEVRKTFEKALLELPSVKYCGVFDSTKSSVYSHLNQYDLLVFPTKWFAEGVPGVLVEAKMAGIAIIASDCSYNSEIVREDQEEGFIVRGDLVKSMFDVISQCYEDKDLLMNMKYGSSRSRKRYSLERFEKIVTEF